MFNTKLLLVVVVCLGIALKSVQSRPRNRINFQIVETTSKISLNRKENVFLADITLGTPPQQFKVALDTEKSAFWVMPDTCEEGLCTTSKLFNSSESTSFVEGNETVRIEYRDMTYVEGEMGLDILVLGNLVIENQEFIIADNVTLDKDEPYDGLLGVAYVDDEEDEDFVTPLENLAKNEVSKNIFSFIISGDEGTLVLGDIDSSIKKESIEYVPLNNEGEWIFEVSKVSIGDDETPFLLHPRDVDFSIDTTISFIGVPEHILPIIGELLKAEYKEESENEEESYVVDCGLRNSTTDIEFEVDDETFKIPPSLYIDYDEDTKECSLNMKAVPENYWVWGTPILESLYVIFDAEENRIGFAEYSD